MRRGFWSLASSTIILRNAMKAALRERIFEGFMLDLTVYDFICVSHSQYSLPSAISVAVCPPSLSLSLCLSLYSSVSVPVSAFVCVWSQSLPLSPSLRPSHANSTRSQNFMAGAMGFAVSENTLKIFQNKGKVITHIFCTVLHRRDT